MSATLFVERERGDEDMNLPPRVRLGIPNNIPYLEKNYPFPIEKCGRFVIIVMSYA